MLTQPYAFYLGPISLTLAMPACIGSAQTQQELDAKSGGGLLARIWRTEACPNAIEPRYPSIVHHGKGQLLLMFTCQVAKTDKAVLVVARSSDQGKSWSEPQTVYMPANGTPRALGTLTRLQSGAAPRPSQDCPRPKARQLGAS